MARICRVLIVEDHADTATSYKALLEMHGFEVSVSHDGGSLDLACLAPDVALVDLGLPRRHGYEVAQEIQQRHPGCKVVIISAHAFPQHVEESRRNGFRHLVKPVDPAELKRIVDQECAEECEKGG